MNHLLKTIVNFEDKSIKNNYFFDSFKVDLL